VTQPALDIRSLSVNHGAVTALRGARFTARSGEITALIGANGAGKSSLLRAIIGLVASVGDILLEGESITHLATEDRIRAGLALVPEGRIGPGLATVGRPTADAGHWACFHGPPPGLPARRTLSGFVTAHHP